MGRRVIAIDWSGRGGRDQVRHIWLCEVLDGEVQRLECGRTRVEVVEYLLRLAAHDPSLAVGFDFAFSVPAWYVADRGLASARELWELVALEQLTPRMEELGLRAWLQEPDWPFWCTRRPPELSTERAFRRTELEVKTLGTQPKSVFQLVGGGQVGRGSLYGMQSLHELSQHRFSIWPFDEPDGAVAVEIFPRTLTGAVVRSDPTARGAFLSRFDLLAKHRDAAEASEDAFDTLVSALAMATAASSFDQLQVEPEYTLEGKIWLRPGVPLASDPR
jgi:hypothetical protein